MSDHIQFFDPNQPVAYLKGSLPHWRQEGAIYFVTFRTADSLPRHRVPARYAHGDRTRTFHELLDAGHGQCPLAIPQCRTIVERTLMHFEHERYLLDELVVAPNHVHVLVVPFENHGLSDIVRSWKSYSAKQINRVLGRVGPLWQKESFDHILRSAAQLESVRAYVRAHPGWRRVCAPRWDG
jgi:REP element-mobilizing transposase RayT